MSLLDINFDDVYEPKTLEADQEARLRISSAVYGSKKSDPEARRLEITLTNPTDSEFKDFTVYLSIPNAEADKKKANAQKKRIQDFYSCFGIVPPLSVNEDGSIPDIVGKEGWVVVGLDDDPEYGKKNTARKFIVSH